MRPIRHLLTAGIVAQILAGVSAPAEQRPNVIFTVDGNKATVALDCFGSKLRPFGVEEGKGFALCGADKVWHWATGVVVGNNDVVVSSPEVAAPIAVRYAWADNPVCNLSSSEGLPVTPFRSDDFQMITKPK